MAALADFTVAMSGAGADAQVSDGLIREWATDALGPEVAQRAFEEMPAPVPADEMLGPVATADAEALAMVLIREHPQTIALVLSALDPARALAVMNRLPLPIQPNVILRMARVEAVSPELLKEVGTALAGELRSAVAGGTRKVEGRANALEILRNKPIAEQGEMVGEIEKVDAELAADIRSRLFTFEDLVHLPDRDIQSLLKEFDTKVLMVALKGASTACNAKILKNMSSRAAEMMKDDMQAMGPVRLADVENAQQTLVAVVSRLATEGRIRIIGPADKMV
jgi:flagellar motor switch protein FliG